MKMQNMKIMDQVAGMKITDHRNRKGSKTARHENATHENAGHENAGHEIAAHENAEFMV